MKLRSLFLIVALLVSVIPVWAIDGAPAPLEVKLTILGGKIDVARAGQSLIDVKSGMSLCAGDIVETLAGARGELAYSDGTLMRMKSGTKIEIQALSLKVFKGQSWFKFTKRGTEFLIETPSLVAGIRGTKFDITVAPRGTTVLAVTEGKVAVRGALGEELMVPAGNQTKCAPGKAPNVITAIPESQLKLKNSQWEDNTWGSANDRNQQFINKHLNDMENK
ncbi:MAG: FecR domain-containing protein [Candidatus Riflebacteria bacterium]|nr:FecR domain-containing protein [Candidatus Riflebacteria bacterium]